MQPLIYTTTMQGKGAFDEGRLAEQRPIGFSGDGSVVKRLGPLFYWAWGTADSRAHIGLHPHQGFEIMTYIIAGYGEHGDTLGTRSRLEPGGVQLMRTGSGVSHEETIGAGGEMFQIWFEPHLSQAIASAPSYEQHNDAAFPFHPGQGFNVKTIVGDGSPLRLTVDAHMWDVAIHASASYRLPVRAGRALAALAVRGDGLWKDAETGRTDSFRHRDFIVVRANEDGAAVVEAGGDDVRLLVIDVIDKPGYPLIRKA